VLQHPLSMNTSADAIIEQDWPGLVDMPEYQSMKRLDQCASYISSLITIPDPLSASQTAYPTGVNHVSAPTWGTTYSGSYSHTTQTTGSQPVRLSNINGSKRTPSQPGTRSKPFQDIKYPLTDESHRMKHRP
jgi:hypothetical protein